MQENKHEVDEEGFARFDQELSIDIYSSADDPAETFYIFKDKPHTDSVVSELLKSGRHVHRHYLGDVALMLIYSSSIISSAHIARSAYKSPINKWGDVINNIQHGVALFNQDAMEMLFQSLGLHEIVKDSVGLQSLFDSAEGPHEELDIRLFYIRLIEEA